MQRMKRVAVESSNVRAIAYDAGTRTLEIVFHPNRAGVASVYRYDNISQEDYKALLEPGVSVGRAINAIKRRPDVLGVKVGEELVEA